MKTFDWSEQKNTSLKAERDICFEDIKSAVEDGRVLEDSEHLNQERYPGQRMLIVEVNDYAYSAPYVEDKGKVFLKTVFPNRKATKKYLRGGNV